jgi:hypothetical protein
MPSAEEVRKQLESIQMETAQVNLQKAQLELEQTKEQVEQWTAARETRRRTNRQRQQQMRMDSEEIARKARECTHRQGGSLKNPYSGKGQSALTLVQLPDAHTVLVMCAICRLRVFSPNERDQARNPRPGETKDEAKARVAKLHDDLAKFNALVELAGDKLTDEAKTPMHCGVTFTFTDGDGREVLMPRPCDGYAQGLDNRRGDAA